MKKLLFTVFAALSLVSCANTAGSGVIDCYSINVKNGGSSVFSQTYQATFSYVFEYKSAAGDALYMSNRYGRNQYNPETDTYSVQYVPIHVFPNRYTSNYVEYAFSRFVGYLTLERNYYLDLVNKTIDSEMRWSEYKYENPPQNPIGSETFDNRDAFACACKNYYYETLSTSDDYAIMRLDLLESSLSRHSYTYCGADSVISYVKKWF